MVLTSTPSTGPDSPFDIERAHRDTPGYASNVIVFLQVAQRTGAVVEVIENDETGQLSVPDLRRRLHDGKGPVKLVAITHVPTQGGLVNPAEGVGAVTREAGVPHPGPVRARPRPGAT